MRTKAVVFGKSGQLGRELLRVLQEREYDVSGFERSQVDVTNAEQVEQVLAATEPWVVLNATAYNAVDLAESQPDAALAGNALAVRNIASACRQLNARLVHFSTDYVFDGEKNSPYIEDDPPGPLGAYGVSKLTGEFFARAYVPGALIIRTSGVFGPGGAQTPRGNFVETMLRLAGSGQPIRVLEDHVASPTYAPALAERTAELLGVNANGTFHLGGGEAVSWFDYARLIFEIAQMTPALHPTNETEYRTPARRPKYSALSNGKAEQCGASRMPPLREAIENYLQTRTRVNSSFAPKR